MGKTMKDLIKDKYKNWNKSDVIILNGATGSGKTYFILNILGNYVQAQSKKILYLVSREKLLNNISQEIEDLNLSNTIKITTYQAIQYAMDKNLSMPTCDYLIYDECHYFTTEGWNGYTDKIFEFFKNVKDNVINIFMSGTGKNIFAWLEAKKYVTKEDNIFTIPYDYSYVDKLMFYNNDETIEDVFNRCLKQKEKVIYFSKTLDRALELYKKYEDNANFICSKTCRYKKYNQENCIKVYDKDLITFEKNILIATTALDVGVTLKDKNIKYIITDLVNIDQLQQCLGRKRIIDETDKCTFYIKNHSKRSLHGTINTIQNNILNDAYEYYHNRENFIKQCDRKIKYNPCFYFQQSDIDDTKEKNSKVGNLMFNYSTYIYYVIQQSNLQLAADEGFDKLVMNRLDTVFHISYLKDEEEQKEKDKLTMYLNSIVGKKLLKEEQKKLINLIGLKDARGRIQKSIKQFNAYFDANRMPYTIKNKRVKINNIRYTAWIIGKIDYKSAKNVE